MVSRKHPSRHYDSSIWDWVLWCYSRKTFAFDFPGFKWLKRLTYPCLLDFIVNCVVFPITIAPKDILKGSGMVVVTQEVICRLCFKISSGIMVLYNSPNESSYRKSYPVEYLELPLSMALEKIIGLKPWIYLTVVSGYTVIAHHYVVEGKTKTRVCSVEACPTRFDMLIYLEMATG